MGQRWAALGARRTPRWAPWASLVLSGALAACGAPPALRAPKDAQPLPAGLEAQHLVVHEDRAWIAGESTGPVQVGSQSLTPRGGALLVGLERGRAVMTAHGVGGLGPVKIHALRRGPQGDLWLVGRFSVQLPWGGHTLQSAGGHDCFFARLDEQGSVRWVRRFGGPGDELCQDILPTEDGAWVLGEFTLDIDEPGEDLTPLETRGGRDLFLLRLDAQGQVTRIARFGGAANERAIAFAQAGAFWGILGQTDGELQHGVSRVVGSAGAPAVFLATLRHDLLPLRAQSLGEGDVRPVALLGTAEGGWAVAGLWRGVGMVVKLDTQLGAQWRRDLPGWGQVRALDRDGSDLLVAGAGGGARVARLSTEGTVLSQRRCGQEPDEARGVWALPSGDALVLGQYGQAQHCALRGQSIDRWRDL